MRLYFLLYIFFVVVVVGEVVSCCRGDAGLFELEGAMRERL